MGSIAAGSRKETAGVGQGMRARRKGLMGFAAVLKLAVTEGMV